MERKIKEFEIYKMDEVGSIRMRAFIIASFLAKKKGRSSVIYNRDEDKFMEYIYKKNFGSKDLFIWDLSVGQFVNNCILYPKIKKELIGIELEQLNKAIKFWHEHAGIEIETEGQDFNQENIETAYSVAKNFFEDDTDEY
ncbi:MAG: hypothetical protein LBQ37_02570 [Elusimicrobiota bacterium]|jgi:hypothetical protein|nr:hypothetical protein [Elusimicrobiota bacterium]